MSGVFIPPPSLGLPADRRRSTFVPQRRASYFASPLAAAAVAAAAAAATTSRRASLLAPPDTTSVGEGLQSPVDNEGGGGGGGGGGNGRRLSSLRLLSGCSRRTSVCTAAEYLMREVETKKEPRTASGSAMPVLKLLVFKAGTHCTYIRTWVVHVSIGRTGGSFAYVTCVRYSRRCINSRSHGNYFLVLTIRYTHPWCGRAYRMTTQFA